MEKMNWIFVLNLIFSIHSLYKSRIGEGEWLCRANAIAHTEKNSNCNNNAALPIGELWHRIVHSDWRYVWNNIPRIKRFEFGREFSWV